MAKLLLKLILAMIVWLIIWFGFNSFLNEFWFLSGGLDIRRLFAMLVINSIACIAAGYSPRLVKSQNFITIWLIGILILMVGFWWQVAQWNKFPFWYNMTFLLIIAPMTFLGSHIARITK